MLQVLAACLSLLVGLGLVGQVRGGVGLTQRLASEREEDLVRILADLNLRSDELTFQVLDLRLALAGFESSSTRESTALKEYEDRLRALQVLTGVVPVRGPGIVITISDPNAKLDAVQLLDLAEELRNAGAEALAVNEARVVAATAFSSEGTGILVGGVRVSAPYLVTAIGESETLSQALSIPGGAIDALTTHAGVEVDLQARDSVDVPALRGIPRFSYAKPRR